MYIVAAKWKVNPGMESEFKEASSAVRSKIRSLDGVEFIHSFNNEDGQVVVLMGYTDEQTYQSLIHAEDGPFQKMMAESKLEGMAEWISSERGEENE